MPDPAWLQYVEVHQPCLPDGYFWLPFPQGTVYGSANQDLEVVDQAETGRSEDRMHCLLFVHPCDPPFNALLFV